jgi:hypothetical protein
MTLRCARRPGSPEDVALSPVSGAAVAVSFGGIYVYVWNIADMHYMSICAGRIVHGRSAIGVQHSVVLLLLLARWSFVGDRSVGLAARCACSMPLPLAPA